jgi:hypothetical protein
MGMFPLPPHIIGFPIMLGAALGLGWLSWRFVEKPFRKKRRSTGSSTPTLIISGSSLAVCALIGLVLLSLNGASWRFSPAAVAVAETMNEHGNMREGVCFITSGNSFANYQKDQCLTAKTSGLNILLVGDSHSAALWYGLSKALPSDNILQASTSGCMMRINLPQSDDCGRMASYIFKDFLASHKVDAIIISERWRRKGDFVELADTVDWLKKQGIAVYIFGPVMEYNAPLPRILAYSMTYRVPGLSRLSIQSGMFGLDAAFHKVATDSWHAHYVSVMQVQCPDRVCVEFADATRLQPMLSDDNHLSTAAALYVVRTLESQGKILGLSSKHDVDRNVKLSNTGSRRTTPLR